MGGGAIIALVVLSTGCHKSTQEHNLSLQKPRILHLYCWSNYFSPTVLKQFENETGVKIDLNYFSSNEELLAKLQAGARGYDVIVPSGYLVRALKTLALIEPLGKIDWQELSNLTGLAQKPKYDPNHEYTIPYAWGTSGLAINRAKIKAKIDSWAWVFEHPELKSQISMLDDAPGVVGLALKYLGYSYNESSPAALAKVKQLLAKQKPLLRSYTSEAQLILETGEVAISHAYSGDTLQVRKRNPNIEYVLPKEGGEIFMDNLAIPKGAPSPELAKDFMRFTLRQKIAAEQVEHLFFSPVVHVNESLAHKELLANHAVFPTQGDLKNYEMMEDNPERVEAIQKLWMELKSL